MITSIAKFVFRLGNLEKSVKLSAVRYARLLRITFAIIFAINDRRFIRFRNCRGNLSDRSKISFLNGNTLGRCILTFPRRQSALHRTIMRIQSHAYRWAFCARRIIALPPPPPLPPAPPMKLGFREGRSTLYISGI